MRKFILVVEEDVVSTISIGNKPKFQNIINACQNNPVFVELPIDSEVERNWTWDGLNFSPPES